MNYQKVIEELEHHARESADFLAGFPDADEMESEKAAHRAMVSAAHALKNLLDEQREARHIVYRWKNLWDAMPDMHEGSDGMLYRATIHFLANNRIDGTEK